jgi:hypothetical protein
MCDTYTWQRRSLSIIVKPILSSERLLHMDYDRKGSVEKNLWSWTSRVWRQDELIYGKPPVVKYLWL